MAGVKVVIAVALGFPLLLIPCLFHLWTKPGYQSIKPWPSGTYGVGPYRPLVREWKWRWLNYWYMNTEDDLSGDGAWIWDANGNLVSYDSTFPTWVPRSAIAFAWSAWRNNANNLKRPLRTDSLNKAWP